MKKILSLITLLLIIVGFIPQNVEAMSDTGYFVVTAYCAFTGTAPPPTPAIADGNFIEGKLIMLIPLLDFVFRECLSFLFMFLKKLLFLSQRNFWFWKFLEILYFVVKPWNVTANKRIYNLFRHSVRRWNHDSPAR